MLCLYARILSTIGKLPELYIVMVKCGKYFESVSTATLRLIIPMSAKKKTTVLYRQPITRLKNITANRKYNIMHSTYLKTEQVCIRLYLNIHPPFFMVVR